MEIMHGEIITLPARAPEKRNPAMRRIIGAHQLTLNLVVISTGNKERLRLVEMHPTDRAIVLIKAVDESTHAVVP